MYFLRDKKRLQVDSPSFGNYSKNIDCNYFPNQQRKKRLCKVGNAVG